jgi:putative NADPH-quinone reductase
MAKKILLIQGHPDAAGRHLCHALQEAYAIGAAEGGHPVKIIQVANLDFPLLRSQEEWERGALPASLDPVQKSIKWCDHLVFFFPLWLGDMPALLKGFLEQVARPEFAFRSGGKNPFEKKALKGRSARVVVTMGMPSLVYRWYFRAHSVRSLERNILGFVGFAPVRESLIGMTGQMEPKSARKWLVKMEMLGKEGI